MEFKNIVVTGGAGFLGSHLVEYFVARGHTVLALDNFCTGFELNRDFLENFAKGKNCGKFYFLQRDVSAPWSWDKELPQEFWQNHSHIFHFATPASPPHYQRLAKETMWVNSLGLNNCLETADRWGSRVIFASTSEVYGDPTIHPQPESYWGNVNSYGPRSCYDEAKRFGEALIYSHNEKFKTKHGMVRIFNTYGPRMNPTDGRVIINLLAQALTDRPLTVYGDGQQTRSFCFVDDLVVAIVRYASTNLTNPVNCGNDREFTILELANILCELFPEKSLKIEHHPLPGDDPKQRRPDLTRAKRDLAPWEPKIPLREGLKKMAEWLADPEILRIFR